jgi:cytoskeletal protein CcmA (bactofilin family)
VNDAAVVVVAYDGVDLMSENEPHRSILGPDCKATGELSVEGDAAVMGQFKGKIRVSGMLDLTDSSSVTGTVVAGAVRLGGRSEADIVAEQGVELLCGSVSSGRLFTNRLSVVDGACFDGHVVVGTNAMTEARDVLPEIAADLDDPGHVESTEKTDRTAAEKPVSTKPAASNLKVHTAAKSLDRVLRQQDARRNSTRKPAARAESA